jgi:hypothetical protein
MARKAERTKSRAEARMRGSVERGKGRAKGATSGNLAKGGVFYKCHIEEG